VEQTVSVAGQHMSGNEMADALGKALGEEVLYRPLSLDAYRGLGFPGADDLGNMFQFYQEFEHEFLAARDIAASRRINPGLQTFKQWLTRNKDRIPMQ
jgi:hypothetical protein